MTVFALSLVFCFFLVKKNAMAVQQDDPFTSSISISLRTTKQRDTVQACGHQPSFWACKLYITNH